LTSDFSRHWDYLDFESVSPSDRFITSFREAAICKGLPVTQGNQFVNMRTDFSRYKDVSDFYEGLGKNMRGNIRKRINNLNRKGVFDIILIRTTGPHLSMALAQYTEIYEASWKRREKDPAFHVRLAQALAAEGKLRLFILYFREKGKSDEEAKKPRFCSWRDHLTRMEDFRRVEGMVPIAALFSIVHRGIAYGLKTAYREEYENLSPGTVLYWFALRYLMEEDSCRFMDHQRGRDTFKFRWLGEVHETRFRLRIANPDRRRAFLELWFQKVVVPRFHRWKKGSSVIGGRTGR